jgi:hypothetical protein
MKVRPPQHKRKKQWDVISNIKLYTSDIHDEIELNKLLKEYKHLYPDHKIIRLYDPQTFAPYLTDLTLREV